MNYRESIHLSRQRGLSIVELLVALVISMLLLTGVVQVFFSSKQTYASNEAASRLQENGRFALEFIAQSARHAGYVEAANTTTAPPNPIATPGATNCNTPRVCSTQGAGNASDTIGFALQPRILEGARRDCLGNTLSGATANTDLIINHFEIIPGADGAPSALGCRSWNFTKGAGEWVAGPGASPLIDGVDALQIQYGISTSGDRNNVNQYVSADRVTALNAWNDVVAVRIAVLANSIEPVDPPAPARRYVLLDAAPTAAFDDGRARQVFTTTIKLRNTF
ncbi:PilW family protein [Pseudomonas sp. PL-6]|jgi:type IV pilus assembly protein PilW